MTIKNCPLLATCEVHGICLYFQNWGLSNVSDNAPGCNSVLEVKAACQASPAHEVFFEKNSLRLSPNPASDFLKIELPENRAAAPLDLRMFDAAGKLVLEKRLVAAGQTLDLTHLAPGVFALKVVAGERVFAGKFIKN